MIPDLTAYLLSRQSSNYSKIIIFKIIEIARCDSLCLPVPEARGDCCKPGPQSELRASMRYEIRYKVRLTKKVFKINPA